MNLKKITLVSLFCLTLAAFSFGDVQFPKPTGFINDYAGILTAADRQTLFTISQSLQQQTGAELAVAIVKTTAPLDSKLYAVKLFENWKIGQKGKDNGVLILLAADDRRIEIEVGYGLEGMLPDALVGRILDLYAVPNFKAGKFADGLMQTAQAVSAVIAKDETAAAASKASPPPNENALGAYFIYVIIGVIILGIILRKTGSIVFGIMGAAWGAGEAGIVGAIFGALLGLFFGFWGMYLGMGRGGLGGGFGSGGGFGGFGGGGSGGGGSGRSW